MGNQPVPSVKLYTLSFIQTHLTTSTSKLQTPITDTSKFLNTEYFPVTLLLISVSPFQHQLSDLNTPMNLSTFELYASRTEQFFFQLMIKTLCLVNTILKSAHKLIANTYMELEKGFSRVLEKLMGNGQFSTETEDK